MRPLPRIAARSPLERKSVRRLPESHTIGIQGTYVNINTGVEVYPSNGNSPGKIRYVDLEIDVVKAPVNEKPRIIDQHLLKRAVQRGFITKEMADQSRSKAQLICDELSSSVG